MSTAPALARIVLLLNGRRDPRRHRRYPVALDVTYKLFHQNGKIDRLGSGQTLDVSSGGACFECVDPFPSTGIIELTINWPCLLEGICPLKLVMRGRIVRADGRRIAVEAEHHEFRTAGIRPMHAHPPSTKHRTLLG
jgi:PilZ domain